MPDRWRIRNIMNGGADGIRAIMAWDQGKGSSGREGNNDLTDLPAVNMMASGVERLAQRIGVPPTLKMPYGPRDSQTSKDAAEKRERMVLSWDDLSRLDMQFPQIGRWLPGYAYYSWVIRPKLDKVTGQLWPHAELRDPFDTWPGYYGPNQQPTEICFRRSVPRHVLSEVYPQISWNGLFAARKRAAPPDVRRATLSPDAIGITVRSHWEGNNGGTQIVEYQDDTGTYVAAPEFEKVISYVPNICDTGPMFVPAKRFSFDRLVSQYHHVTGLVAMVAKLNVLALIAAEDSTFRETNIIGDLEGNTYERGRFAVNFFERGTSIERPTGENNAQIYHQIDRLTNQLRIGANYSPALDSQPAQGGWITGQGQDRLDAPVDSNVSEYQRVIGDALESLDTRRLEWEQKHERSKKKRVFWLEGDRHTVETYVPSADIAGNWRTQRIFGMMAGWDDSTKIVAGLQLLQARVIDVDTFRDNLKGIQNSAQINERLARDRAREDLFTALEQLAASGDPRAMMALTEIQERPDRTIQILKKFFTPEEPQMSPAEQQMAGGPPQGEMGPPPSVQTVLSELGAGGSVRGGAQTVTVNRQG